jgi:hypothetical protein
MKPERRRSDRVMLTIPVVIRGVDNHSGRFEVEGRTISLNRHGLLLHVNYLLRLGQVVVLSNLLGRREAEFRVTGPVAPLVEGVGEWALESVDPDSNIWGIKFPPLAESESEEARGLLECRGCHAVVLMRVSQMETEVLTTSGLLSKRCESCRKVTPWGYAEKQIAMDAPTEEIEMFAEASELLRRRHPRVSLQLPALIRDFYGGAEIAKSENVSKGGLCFASDVVYHVGQGLRVVCPYDPSSPEIVVHGRIVRCVNFEGRHRRLYGVRYEDQNE